MKFWHIIHQQLDKLIIALFFFLGLYIFHKHEPKAQIIWEYIDYIRQTAILILGVIGAWIAVLFPFVYVTDREHENKDKINELLKKLFKPFKYSLFIVGFTLLRPFSIVVTNIFGFSPCIIILFKYIFVALVFAVTALLFFALVRALDPFDYVMTSIQKEDEKKNVFYRMLN